MARINSKTNWNASDRPLAPDFNRIESNNEQSFSEIDVVNSNLTTETNARISAITTETNARISGDNNLDTIKLNNSTMGPRTFSTVSAPSSDYIIPSGTYYINETTGFGRILVRDSGGTWRGSEMPMSGMSLIISDGVNVALQAGLSRVYHIIKIS